MRWRIYYDDGSTYEGESEEDAVKAPPLGVQVIYVDNGVTTGRDMYLWKGGRFWGCDEAGMWDYLFNYPEPKKILFGRTMPTWEEYNEILQRAIREKLGV